MSVLCAYVAYCSPINKDSRVLTLIWDRAGVENVVVVDVTREATSPHGPGTPRRHAALDRDYKSWGVVCGRVGMYARLSTR